MSQIISIDGPDIHYGFESVILVPEKGIREHGYIQAMTVKDTSNAKHEYHAMAQMAYFQYQDDELEIELPSGTLTVTCRGEAVELIQGLILGRDSTGAFKVFIHEGISSKKILEAAYRYCTRWVRLDI